MSGSSEKRRDTDTEIRGAIEKRTGKSPEMLYEEREKRVRDAIQLREPDRVPVVLGLGYFPARYTGLPLAAAYYDALAWKEACKKTIVDFEPDLYGTAMGNVSGHVFEALGLKQMRWPGFSLPESYAHQFVEGEYMKREEYDLFLSDPSDFIMRYHLPRVFSALEPLSKLPPLRNFTGTSFTALLPFFASPEFRQVAEALSKAGQEEEIWRGTMSTYETEMANLGFPASVHPGGVGAAPFDVISDYLRGMRGSMTDIYRCPDKLLAACEKILEWRIARGVPADPNKRGNPKRVFMALHRGSEGFLSKKQYEEFYWPGLKKAILATIELGYVPMPFFEGKFESRLEYLLELPKGSIICRFVDTDMARAKAILGDHFCIMGNVPLPLLQVGSVTEVEEYCRKLIITCGKGGGFILTSGSDSIDAAKPENVKAMVDSVKKFGVN